MITASLGVLDRTIPALNEEDRAALLDAFGGAQAAFAIVMGRLGADVDAAALDLGAVLAADGA